MSILRNDNAHVFVPYFSPCRRSNLRKAHVTCHYLLSLCHMSLPLKAYVAKALGTLSIILKRLSRRVDINGSTPIKL